MKKGILLFTIILAALLGWAVFRHFGTSPVPPSEEEASEDFPKGPHGGRLLGDGDFQTEITIFEPEGITPKFRIYFFADGTSVDPTEVKYAMELTRINRVEKIPFGQQGDFLESLVEASEPHSFRVKAMASYKGVAHEWDYESYEGRVTLSPEMIKANKVAVEQAGPVNMEIKLGVMGKIRTNEEESVSVTPRFPGLVKAVYKMLGDKVKKGEILAQIESNDSLQTYDVASPMDGTIIRKDISAGMNLSGQEMIYTISNLATVWADFNLYRQDLPHVDVGDPISVKNLDGSLKEETTLSYISPIGQERSQSILARAVLKNAELAWKPGLFVKGEILVEKIPIQVAVKAEALQTYRDWDVVFINVKDQFEVVPVTTGRRNREWVEITKGLSPGDKYVSKNSFLMKADLEKFSAEHDD